MVRYLTLLSLIATTSLSACSFTTPKPENSISTNRYAITDVTILDVENGITVPGQTVIIIKDRIDEIGAQGKVNIPEGATIIPGRGLYLMPGLVDAHVHYLDAPVFGRLMIANGVVLVRDMGMPNEYILNLRDDLNRGAILGPEMVAAGYILDGVPPILPMISVGAQTPEEGRAAVRQQAQAGADFIKVYSRLEKEVFLAILDEAQKQGLQVVGHIPDSIPLEEAAAAGMTSSEHFFGFEKALARLLGEPVNQSYQGMGAEADILQRLDELDPGELDNFYQRIRLSGLTICPTVVTFKVGTQIETIKTGNFPHSETISPQVLNIWQSQWSQQGNLPNYIWLNWARLVREMNQAGIPLMIGTDLMVPGILPGYAVHEEMVIWQEAGVPAAEVLRSATIVPARLMGMGDRLGSIDIKKTASIVLVKANPLEDIRNAQQIEGIFLRGQYFSRKDLDQLLTEAKDLAQQPTPP